MTGDLVAQLFTDLKGAPPIQVYIIIKYGNKMYFSYKQWNPVNFRHFLTWRKMKTTKKNCWHLAMKGRGDPPLTFFFCETNFFLICTQIYENYTLIPENLQQRIIYRVIYNIALYNAMIYGILYFFHFSFHKELCRYLLNQHLVN